ncbi:hypothetical protein [Mycolicibacterium conceptionense]|jgi:hypothetical protein|uniref:hypothetical protein n=1 Tax=Mycolicibacterium conceptionense TaxID=451644 RepID=UPI000B143A85|nr:hypothetical protein [Mycolicibacterium conceptionense]
MRTIDSDAEPSLVDTLAALLREVDGSHSLGAAALAEELVKRGVTIEVAGSRVYAPAALRGDGTIEPVSNSFSTLDLAEQELAGLLGDDYYRDCRPFVATSVAQVWRPVEVPQVH